MIFIFSEKCEEHRQILNESKFRENQNANAKLWGIELELNGGGYYFSRSRQNSI